MRGRLASLLALGAALVLSGSVEAASGADSSGRSVPAAAVLQAQQTQPTQQPAAAPQPVPELSEAPASRTSGNAPFPAGVESDVYCSGWIGEFDEAFPGGIFAAEQIDTQTEFFEGHVVYLDMGTEQGVAAGQEFWVVRPSQRIERPENARYWVGQLYLTPGRVRVICAHPSTSIAEITLSCQEVEVGDRILPFEPVPIPLVRATTPLTSCEPGTGKAEGRIVYARDGGIPLATGSVVFLDLGEESGLSPGDFLSVFRVRGEDKQVRTYLGEVAVLKTRPKTAVGMITSMRDIMGPGDFVELK